MYFLLQSVLNLESKMAAPLHTSIVKVKHTKQVSQSHTPQSLPEDQTYCNLSSVQSISQA